MSRYDVMVLDWVWDQFEAAARAHVGPCYGVNYVFLWRCGGTAEQPMG